MTYTFDYDVSDYQTIAICNGTKVGAVWGPSVEDYWFAYRHPDTSGLRFATREDAEAYLRGVEQVITGGAA